MYLILVIGHTGQGKTTVVNKIIEGKNQYVFDVNNEYHHLSNDKDGFTSKMRNTDLNIGRFVANCARLKNTNIVFEDATGFLQGRQSREMSRLMAAKRHSQNNYLILFHSINRVPPELMEMSNYILLFKTNDFEDNVVRKFGTGKLHNAFLDLRNKPKFSFFKIDTI